MSWHPPPPADLLAMERRELFLRRRAVANETEVRPVSTGISVETALRVALRNDTFTRWRRRLDEAEKGRWTRTVVRDVSAWSRRKHGFMTFHLTQLLSGHGCFGTFLQKIGKELTTVCHHCGYETDDAEHTMFRCTSWEEERAEVVRVIGEFDPESVIGKMLNAPECWNAVSRYATSVMLQKEDAERIRRKEPERGVTT